MSTFKYSIATLFVLILSLSPLSAQPISKIPESYCMSQQEYRLYNLINDYRTRLSLSEIPLSRSLSYVAKTHAADLSAYFPIGEDCNMHSWSDKGNWKPFCFPADQNRKNDVKDKAKELTDYPGKAWEITYWENSEADLAFVLDFWNSIPYTADMISNHGKWADKNWKSIGIGIQNGYVLVWFGLKEDVEISTTICETGEKIMNKSIPNELVIPVATTTISSDHLFYIIIGSFKNKKDGQAAVDSYHQMGYKNAAIVEADGRVRVAIDKFSSQKKADEALVTYRNKFQGAWAFSK